MTDPVAAATAARLRERLAAAPFDAQYAARLKNVKRNIENI